MCWILLILTQDDYANCDIPFDDSLKIPEKTFPGLDMIVEQSKDPAITEMIKSLSQGDVNKKYWQETYNY